MLSYEITERAIERYRRGMPRTVQDQMNTTDIASRNDGYVTMYFRGAYSGRLLATYNAKISQGPGVAAETAWSWFRHNYPGAEAILCHD